MYQIILEIEVKNIDFNSESFESSIIPIKKFIKNSSSLNKEEEELNDLLERISQLKGDWYNIDHSYILNNLYIKFTFIFHTKEFTDEQKELVDKVLKECNSVFVDDGYEDYLEEESINNIFENDGFFISYSDKESEIDLNCNSIEEILKSNNIDFRTISINKSEIECGASNSFENFMIFILVSAQSGVTWDFIKIALSNKLGIDFEKIKLQMIDDIEFRKLRRTVANRINASPESILLTYFYRDNDENQIILSMKCKRKYINLICDKHYNIREMTVE